MSVILNGVGDSVYVQYSPYLRAALPATFNYQRNENLEQAMTNLDVPQGANGGDSRRCLGIFEKAMARPDFEANVILFNCGLHDIKQPTGGGPMQVPLAEYTANLQRIIQLVQARGIRLVWVTITPVCESKHNLPRFHIWRCEKDVQAYNQAARELMTQAGISVIDLHTFSLEQGPLETILPDGRHFSPEVQAKQGRFIAEQLQKLCQA